VAVAVAGGCRWRLSLSLSRWRLALAADNRAYLMMMIVRCRGMIYRLRAEFELSIEAQVFYHYGYTSAEHDTVVLAWKEKIRHDLVRPTSLVRKQGLLFAFFRVVSGGPLLTFPVVMLLLPMLLLLLT
jgi:hypothetical protein